MKVEICLDSLPSVAASAEAGAHRIELCSGLVEGGLTPSIGVLKQARRIFPGGIVMMIRPRGGDFLYSPDELAAMADDIRAAAEHGADAVVFGCLQADGSIDEAACEPLIAAAGGLPVVFHRAFDVSADLSASLETLTGLGFTRVLTSGGAPTAVEGAEVIGELVRQAAGRIEILPGGGIRAENAATVAATGAGQIHLTGRRTTDSTMTFRRPEIPMGAGSVPGEYEHRTTDPNLIRQLLASF
ncbi:copper homeostasis protein CutC [Haloferula helveola]|uniref:PF03932 family protein CutC n=1 Tax=Haloferula helveola TaxID=490095 RepID=A0ABM7RBP4_9BACT|nr:copper homeostasis protein CutC [Haloferula helveola]